MTTWELHSSPFRHYKATTNGKSTWNGANKQRIQSVTTILDGPDGLTGWAAQQALTAASAAVARWYEPISADIERLLPITQMALLTRQMPDQIRDAAGARGTLCHEYLGERLGGPPRHPHAPLAPFGYREAIDAFLRDHDPETVADEQGPRLERAVGSTELAVAGTYDAQVRIGGRVHRLDLKSSNTIRATHLAQLAAYEMLAQRCGEDPSDVLTVLHIDGCGNYKLHSIEVGGPEYDRALDLFFSYLTQVRATAALDKLLKKG